MEQNDQGSGKNDDPPSNAVKDGSRSSHRGQGNAGLSANNQDIDDQDPKKLGQENGYTERKSRKHRNKQTFDIRPKVVRQFRIYNISSKQPV